MPAVAHGGGPVSADRREQESRSRLNGRSSAWKRLIRLAAGFFENSLRPRGIENSAGTEAREHGRALFGSAAVFLHEVDHLLRQRVADHAVSAHGGKHHDLRIG